MSYIYALHETSEEVGVTIASQQLFALFHLSLDEQAVEVGDGEVTAVEVG